MSLATFCTSVRSASGTCTRRLLYHKKKLLGDSTIALSAFGLSTLLCAAAARSEADGSHEQNTLTPQASSGGSWSRLCTPPSFPDAQTGAPQPAHLALAPRARYPWQQLRPTPARHLFKLHVSPNALSSSRPSLTTVSNAAWPEQLDSLLHLHADNTTE